MTGVSMLADVFHDRGNETLDGALLEALARLFARNVRVYAYPMRADSWPRVWRAHPPPRGRVTRMPPRW